MNDDLGRRYESPEEDRIYGVGLIQLTGAESTPFVHVHYCDRSRAKLEVVREWFQGELILISTERKRGQHHVSIGTREMIGVQQREGAHTSILRAPAWDAHLVSVEDRAFRRFEADRRRHGGYRLEDPSPAPGPF